MKGYQITPEGARVLTLINRLQRLVRLHREYCGPKPELNRLGVRLMERAIAATSRDLLDAGLSQAALDEYLGAYLPQQLEKPS